jgi:TonB family protein
MVSIDFYAILHRMVTLRPTIRGSIQSQSQGDVMKYAIAILLLSVAYTCPLAPAETTNTSDVAVRVAVAPNYPIVAGLLEVGGLVEVKLDLAPDGTVEMAEILEGHNVFQEAVLSSAKEWRFESGDSGRVVQLVFVFQIMPIGTPSTDLVTRFYPPYKTVVRRTIVVPESNFDPDGVTIE